MINAALSFREGEKAQSSAYVKKTTGSQCITVNIFQMQAWLSLAVGAILCALKWSWAIPKEKTSKHSHLLISSCHIQFQSAVSIVLFTYLLPYITSALHPSSPSSDSIPSALTLTAWHSDVWGVVGHRSEHGLEITSLLEQNIERCAGVQRHTSWQWVKTWQDLSRSLTVQGVWRCVNWAVYLRW